MGRRHRAELGHALELRTLAALTREQKTSSRETLFQERRELDEVLGPLRERQALGAADLRADVPKIEAPTLVICGENDIPSFLESARWLAGNIKGAKLEWLPGARHASVIECPELAVKLLREFLS